MSLPKSAALLTNTQSVIVALSPSIDIAPPLVLLSSSVLARLFMKTQLDIIAPLPWMRIDPIL